MKKIIENVLKKLEKTRATSFKVDGVEKEEKMVLIGNSGKWEIQEEISGKIFTKKENTNEEVELLFYLLNEYL